MALHLPPSRKSMHFKDAIAECIPGTRTYSSAPIHGIQNFPGKAAGVPTIGVLVGRK